MSLTAYGEVEVGPGNHADNRTTQDQRRSRQSLSIPPMKEQFLDFTFAWIMPVLY